MTNRLNKISLLLLIAVVSVLAQLSEQEVRQRLDLIHSGKVDQVRSEVTSLLRQSPNDPAILYLDAYVTTNGDQAVKKYQSIVDLYPQNDWADDALYKVYQYYYAVGLYKTAEAKINQLNQQYPNSIFAKIEAKPSEIGIQKPTVQPAPVSTTPNEETTVVSTPQATPSPSTTVSGAYVVQIGVYSQESKAVEMARTFSSTVGRQTVVFSKLSGGRTVYAVGFDGFTDEQSARSYGADVKAKFNIDWFLVKR